ncbi:hypothetical protein [Nodosilinea sp. E11]|uniref:hypothetical protein n=1 Tax=Nodosilinea sp. E11 TaxID=3037479 RepID=UPI0029349AD1|nr:hypothetical protein [Nodosilinea sp. E11]WOD40185.1 hypothetical protein RRF56_05195 [Nodosilinea sp. E11]
MLPLIVVENLVSPFKFWHEGIHVGMLYRNDFYMILQKFDSVDRTQAHAKATEESNKGFKVCITVSKTHYTVWVEMRSRMPSIPAPVPCLVS